MRRAFWWFPIRLLESSNGHFRIWRGPETASFHPVSLRVQQAERLASSPIRWKKQPRLGKKTRAEFVARIAIYTRFSVGTNARYVETKW